jgi:3-methyladenine DNA glycosylase AlkD
MEAAIEVPSVEELASEIAATIRALPHSRTVPVRDVRRIYSKRLAKSPTLYVIEVALRLLDEPGIDRFVAYELVQHHRAAMASLDEKQLERFGRGLDQWGEVDCFACYLAGPAWRERQVSDKFIRRWANSRNRWRRRAALVSTVPLNNKARGGTGDTPRTLEVCRLLISDRDDMVVKAMSWALRELSKRDRTAVQRFLAEHQRVLAARVVREVTNKLSTGLKSPRLRSAGKVHWKRRQDVSRT